MVHQEILDRCPPASATFIQSWLAGYDVVVQVAKQRGTKLGDYRSLPGNHHRITVNAGLPEELFFFVLTHEIAHLHTFARYGRQVKPHGAFWKNIFGQLLLQSLVCYSENLRPVIRQEAASPRANFLASAGLSRYFHSGELHQGQGYMQDLAPGDTFHYKGHEYAVKGQLKKNYLCRQVSTGRMYSFKPMAIIEILS